MDFTIENNSGQGKNSTLPPEIKGWNWGAFFLNWIWGIGNSTFIALLMFVPIVNFAMPFVLGAKGNKWAWQNRTWRSVEHFKKSQKRWGIAGLLLVCVGLPPLILSISMGMKSSDAYTMSLAQLQHNQRVIKLLGEPVEAGFFVSGNISVSTAGGQASLGYLVSGPKGEATAYVYAVKELGLWKLIELGVYSEALQRRIILIVDGENVDISQEESLIQHNKVGG